MASIVTSGLHRRSVLEALRLRRLVKGLRNVVRGRKIVRPDRDLAL